MEESEKEKVLRNIIEDIHKHDIHLTTGNLCSRYIIEILLQNGEEDLAYQLLTQTIYPSWGYMINNNATTVWERWEDLTEEEPLSGMDSRNHPMNGAVGVCFHKYFAGINIDETVPGFKKIVIKPIVPQKMEHAYASIDTMRGKVCSEWRKNSDGNFWMGITVHFNCNGEIHVPMKNMDSASVEILANGTSIWKQGESVQNKGINIDGMKKEYLVLETESGKFTFLVSSKR